jgi:cytochrome c553
MTMRKLAKKPKKATTAQKFPPGWDEDRVRKLAAHYENQTEDEAVAEDKAAYAAEGQTVMIVPTELVPGIRQLLKRRQGT